MKWFANYLQAASEQLLRIPHAEAATNTAFVAPFLKQAMECSTCKISAFDHLQSFTKNLTAEINKRIHEVRTII